MIHYDRLVSSACPSGYALDRLLAAELGDEADAIRDHVGRCAPCGERLTEMERGRRHPALVGPLRRGASVEPRRHALRLVVGEREAGGGEIDEPDADRALATPVREALPRRRSRRVGAPIAMVACLSAAGVVALVAPRGSGPAVAPMEVTRVKGGHVRVGFYVERGGEVRTGGPGEVVHPGDSLQFVYTAAEAGFLAIVSRDGAGVGTIYFDDGTGRAAPIARGSGVALPRSVVLDATLGRETLHILGCRGDASVEAFRQAVTESREPAPPTGCLMQVLHLDKRSP